MATNKVITVTTPSVVTNDTLASYNAYSDQDGSLGSLSVAEAAAGKTFALSDGVVHSVTVKPVGTSNGEFSAVISNAVSVDLSGGGVKTIDQYVYDSAKNVSAITTGTNDPDSVFVNPTGSKIYTLALAARDIHELNLSTEHDLTTLAAGTLLDSASAMTGLYIKRDDGLMAYTVNNTYIYMHTLSSAWSLASPTSIDVSRNLSAQSSSLTSITGYETGNKFYACQSNGIIYQYSVSDWSNLTVTFDKSFDLNTLVSGLTVITGNEISTDGSKWYALSQDDLMIYEFDLGTAGDIATLTYNSKSLDISAVDTKPVGLFVTEDNILYTCGWTNHSIYKWV